MRIIINEHQEALLEAEVMSQEVRDKIKRVEAEKAELEDYIEQSGEYMVDITNGKTYMVQYLKALSGLVGKDYAMCAPVRSDGTYGAFYVKPWETFKKSEALSNGGGSGVKTPAKKNLYQMMGYNER